MNNRDYQKQGRQNNHASWNKHLRPYGKRAAHKAARSISKLRLQEVS